MRKRRPRAARCVKTWLIQFAVSGMNVIGVRCGSKASKPCPCFVGGGGLSTRSTVRLPPPRSDSVYRRYGGKKSRTVEIKLRALLMPCRQEAATTPCYGSNSQRSVCRYQRRSRPDPDSSAATGGRREQVALCSRSTYLATLSRRLEGREARVAVPELYLMHEATLCERFERPGPHDTYPLPHVWRWLTAPARRTIPDTRCPCVNSVF